MSKVRPLKRTPQEWVSYENHYLQTGAQFIAGVDEVGRGCLAGPVVAAAVILPPGCFIEGINDSKKLTAKKRQALFQVITNLALYKSVAMVDPREIDRINILQASFQAMRLSLSKLQKKPDMVLVDGKFPIPDIPHPQEAIINGDAKSVSIAAASIFAKVLRDRLMVFYSRHFPHYALEQNKGYGTKAHRQGLQEHGPTPIHRYTFAGVLG